MDYPGYTVKEHFKQGSNFLSKPRAEQLHPLVNTLVEFKINSLELYDDNTTGINVTCSLFYYPPNYFETWGVFYNCWFILSENRSYRSLEQDIQSKASLNILVDMYSTTKRYCFTHFNLKIQEEKGIFINLTQDSTKEEDLIVVNQSVLAFLGD